MINSGKEWDWMDKIELTKGVWNCTCGAINVAYKTNCGNCEKNK
jgi:hypothetical protein